jgi:hypothetical protein
VTPLTVYGDDGQVSQVCEISSRSLRMCMDMPAFDGSVDGVYKCRYRISLLISNSNSCFVSYRNTHGLVKVLVC